MINRILNYYLDNLKNKGIEFDTTFIDTEYERLFSILKLVNLPERAIVGPHIDITKLPNNLKFIYDNFEDICYSPDSALVSVRAYSISSVIVSALVEKLYKRCLIEDVTIPLVLYIDTEQLVEDLGAIVSKSKGEVAQTPKLYNSLDTIYEYLYTARYVFWDRFRLDFSNYYNDYIYGIIKRRYNDCLGNMYFTDMQYNNFFKEFKPNVLDVMSIKSGSFNLLLEQDKIKLIGGTNSNVK